MWATGNMSFRREHYAVDGIFGNRILRSDHAPADFRGGLRPGQQIFLICPQGGSGTYKAKKQGTVSWRPGHGLDADDHKNYAYLERALSDVPEGFGGKLLEVPVGTGVLTMPVYRGLPDADITCLDYSPDMMSAARADRMGIENVRFVQGDVGALPFDDGRFDTVLCLNGFHAFPDKEAAFRETFRVLKPGGTFCGCFYIRGGCARTDWFIKHK